MRRVQYNVVIAYMRNTQEQDERLNMQVANLHVWLRSLGTLDLEVPYVHASVRTEPGAVHTWECTYGTTALHKFLIEKKLRHQIPKEFLPLYPE